MRWILLASIVSASALAAGPTRTAEPAPANDLRARPQPAKGKKGLHPIGFLRRLGKAESEFPLRLSSLGIQQEAESGQSQALTPPIPATKTSTLLTLRGQAFDPSAAFWRLPGMIEVKVGSAAEPEVVGDEVASSSVGCALDCPDGGN